MSTVKIKLIKSPIGRIDKHKKTIKALGLRKMNQVVEHNDTPQIRGMIKQVEFMVEILD